MSYDPLTLDEQIPPGRGLAPPPDWRWRRALYLFETARGPGHKDDRSIRSALAYLHARHADQADVLRERGMRKRVEDAADQRAQTVDAQTAHQRLLIDRTIDHVADRDKT